MSVVMPEDLPMSDDSKAEFHERVALSDNRRSVIAELIPGSEDYYFYNGLLALQEGNVESAKKFLASMTPEYGRNSAWRGTAKFREFQTRVRLAQWGRSPADTKELLAFLQRELRLSFDHVREPLPGAASSVALALPSVLAPAKVASERMLRLVVGDNGALSLKDGAVAWALQQEGLDHLRRALLQGLRRPTVPHLETLLGDEPFGSLEIHGRLTVQQLEDLRALRPSVAREGIFVACYCSKLAPSRYEDAGRDDEALERFFDRLRPLEKFNVTLRAKILYGRMEIGRRRGRCDPALLLEYLSIPKRHPGWRSYAKAHVKRHSVISEEEADMAGEIVPSLLPTVNDDEPLVRDFLLALFSQPDQRAPQTPPPAAGAAAWGSGLLSRLGGGSVHATSSSSSASSPQPVARSPAAAAVSAALEPLNPLLEAGILDYSYVVKLLAEAKLLYRDGNTEIWYDVLRKSSRLTADSRTPLDVFNDAAGPSGTFPSDSAVQSLVSRVDIEFTPWNKRIWAPEDGVTLHVFLKNVPELTVKLFEINAFNYLRDKEGDDISTDIDLDGMTAGFQQVIRVEAAPGCAPLPIRRTLRSINLSHLKNRSGIFVAELIGNGTSSRAIIRKGQLRYVERRSAAGCALRMLHTDGTPAGKDARAWVEGREYTPNEDGEVVIPFGHHNVPRQRILLTEGSLTSVEYFHHRQERYELVVGVRVDEGALVAREEVPVLIRPMLLMDGWAAPLALLEHPTLTICWGVADGEDITRVIRNVALTKKGEVVETVRVPEKAKSLLVTLSASVSSKRFQGASASVVSGSRDFSIVDPVASAVEAIHLSRDAAGYHVRLLGRAGEPKPGRTLTLTFRHRLARQRTQEATQLCTDEEGACHLGDLNGLAELFVRADRSRLERSFALRHDKFASTHLSRSPPALQGRAGDTLRLPYRRVQEGNNRLFPDETEGISLLEFGPDSDSGNRNYLADVTKRHVTLTEGWIELRSLPAGDYEVFLPWLDVTVDVHVIPPLAAEEVAPTSSLKQYVAGRTSIAELSDPLPLSITSVAEGKGANDTGDLYIQLGGFSDEYTRVHVELRHFAPLGPFPAIWNACFVDGTGLEDPWLSTVSQCTSQYLSGRKLGDEVRYVLERRHQQGVKTGNMLERPQLLLHPWAIRSTETEVKEAAKGGSYERMEDAAMVSERLGRQRRNRKTYEQLELALPAPFCPTPLLLSNLRPDQSGMVRVRASERRPSLTLARIVAVDGVTGQVAACEWALTARGDPKQSYRTPELVKGLNPAKNYGQQRSVAILEPGDKVVIDDITTAQVQAYDTMEKAHTLFGSLMNSSLESWGLAGQESGRDTWQKFAFVSQWRQLSEGERLAKLEAHACHELHLFLFFKDRPFFDKHVLPALQSKMDRSFLDDWLLGNTKEVLAWAQNGSGYELLNAAELGLLAGTLAASGRAGEAAAVAKDLEDASEVAEPANAAEAGRRFEAALLGGVMGVDDIGFANSRAGAVQAAELAAMQQRVTGAAPGWSGWAGAEERSFGAASGGSPTHRITRPSPFSGLESFSGPLPMAAMAGLGGATPRYGAPASFMQQASPFGMPGTPLRSARSSFVSPIKKSMMHDKQESADLAYREEQEEFFQAPERTKEHAETHYWQRPLTHQTATLVPPNAFWADFARHQAKGGRKPFLSCHLADAGGSFAGSMLALAVIGLPFAADTVPSGKSTPSAPPHSVAYSGLTMSLQPLWPLVLYREQVTEAPPRDPGAAQCVLVRHTLFDPEHASAARTPSAAQDLEIAPGEPLQAGWRYGARVVATNVSSTTITAAILLQIPEGAVPLGDHAMHTRCEHREMPPFSTISLEAFFYFPRPGTFRQFPAHISRALAGGAAPETGTGGAGGSQSAELLAVATGVPTQVAVLSEAEAEARRAAKATKEGWGEGPEAWPAVSQRGTSEQVLAYLANVNLRTIDLTSIAWRMTDLGFFQAALSLLRKRHVYNQVLWSYGVHHGDQTAVHELLQHSPNIVNALGPPVLDSALLKLEPGAGGRVYGSKKLQPYEHLEYYPLVNARVHALGGKKEGLGRIRNKRLLEQYSGLLDICCRRPSLSGDEALQAAYYLLLQDRVEEAEAMYKRAVKAGFAPSPIASSSSGRAAVPGSHAPAYSRLQMQADYMAAYLDLYSSDPQAAVARQVARAYADCPVPAWRARFAEIQRHLDEAEQGSMGAGEDLGDEIEGWELMDAASPSSPIVGEGEGNPSSIGARKRKPTPTLEIREEKGGALLAEYSELDTITVNLYVMDVELLFSTNPFVKQKSGAFAYIAPNWSRTEPLPPPPMPSSAKGGASVRGTKEILIPDEFKAKNVLVEVSGKGIQRTHVRYSHAGLWVEVVETKGQLKVMHRASQAPPPGTGKSGPTPVTAGLPVRSAYVKAYCRYNDGRVAFYKDGYTDRRGRFDYASLSTDELDRVNRFALLVASDELGVLIREARPPPR